jgi:hypothetical protein
LTPIHSARVKGNQIIWHDVHKLNTWLLGVQGDVEVVIKKPRRTRSNNQNGYYWAVIITGLAGWLGWEKEELHEALKARFLREPQDDHRLPDKIKSTTELNTMEFETYLEEIRQWALNELDYLIPLPNEVE